MRRLYHIARADFLQRIRSRRLLVVLAVIAYVGYLVNVGQIELAYQVTNAGATTNYGGVNTAAFIGLKAGLTGAAVVLFGGFYLMKDTLARDHRYNMDQLVASSSVSGRTYLTGKWLSNVALGVVILLTLGFATVVNHVVHGVGPTKLLPLLTPLFAFALPLCALVGAVALFFDTVSRLNGTLGNILYLLLVALALSTLAMAQNSLPGAIPLQSRVADIMGHMSVYELTADALLAEVPSYSGGLPSVGALAGDQTFRYTGGNWPLWVYLQRIVVFISAIPILVAATVAFDRTPSAESSDSSGWIPRLVEALPTVSDEDNSVRNDAAPSAIDSVSLTAVTDRDAGGFMRLVAAEVRLALRGQPWWWYIGAVALLGSPVVLLLTGSSSGSTVSSARRILLPLALVWPIFVWSEMGVRTDKHGMTSLVLSSKYAHKQLIAEWVAGVVVAVSVSGGLPVLFIGAGHPELLLGYLGGISFAPSFAIAAGIWTRSGWLFEIVYLMIWYVGPLNSAVPADFMGTTAESVHARVPLMFAALSIVLLGAAILRRRAEIQ
ncbi:MULTISPECIES: hypothetical protein [Halobacterium]|uniref:Uncharacterized protein n=2 Tax=Halobacterium salinarum TaxID=2242 RepID=B0RA01_HALS3|nr:MULTISPECIES: hypothetical protein [Halobacterium]MBB6090860.1 hypothetical protein [Halobacterium salinarum]MDL0137923.1 hypothetical protein [Halobacterium salinarum]MDL0141676.1 hypothetical protein [Halobacterium salinarum]QRY21502.1 hypothetical protein JT689_00835 [Halobacterium sp. GSL-19]QRY26100.1 ABC transporter permease [Halobacterium sp. BOL4-2]